MGLKEPIQLVIIEYLAQPPYAQKNARLVYVQHLQGLFV